jgi:hypothetical protein
VRYSKKLLFAVLVGASRFDAVSLPLCVFVALLALLLLQVRAFDQRVKRHRRMMCTG